MLWRRCHALRPLRVRRSGLWRRHHQRGPRRAVRRTWALHRSLQMAKLQHRRRHPRRVRRRRWTHSCGGRAPGHGLSGCRDGAHSSVPGARRGAAARQAANLPRLLLLLLLMLLLLLLLLHAKVPARRVERMMLQRADAAGAVRQLRAQHRHGGHMHRDRSPRPGARPSGARRRLVGGDAHRGAAAAEARGEVRHRDRNDPRPRAGCPRRARRRLVGRHPDD
mmetsp:Transcript_87997/g.248378  ORF Transcript_87997/g.248378 Transcript_87997/m.248378 type:complete len:222 (-) Transcript_87997:186-851(-)